jgi:Gpi18-like mannosyltransferase
MLKRLFENKSIWNVVFIWFAWAIIMLGYQTWVTARFDLKRPDYALDWTPTETQANSHAAQPYLLSPFMKNQVAWDSEFYLSIATSGYTDPDVRIIGMSAGHSLSLNYAFMPFYPIMIWLLAWPLKLFGLAALKTTILSGVLVSLLGTLAGMLGIYDLARRELDESNGIRAAFYLLVFPAGFFLAQVYTEGLFVGLAFASLALLKRNKIVLAAILAACATLTRAVGVALIFPMVLPWISSGEWMDLDLEWVQIYQHGLPWKAIGRALVRLLPLITFIAWRLSWYGMSFAIVEDNYFGRGFFSLGTSYYNWSNAFQSLSGYNPQMAAYYVVEFIAIIIAVAACISEWKVDRTIAIFSILVVVLSLTSGPAQGMHRYVLGAPAVFLALARWGRHPAFDKVWTLASTLMMGVFAIMYTFDFWAG